MYKFYTSCILIPSIKHHYTNENNIDIWLNSFIRKDLTNCQQNIEIIKYEILGDKALITIKVFYAV